MTCNNPQPNDPTPFSEQQSSCWLLPLVFYRTAIAIIIGMLTSPAFVYGTGPTQQNVSEITSESLSIEQRHSQEIQELKDRVTFLEEQQSSILVEIDQRVILGGYGALEFESFQGSNTTFEGKLEVLFSGQIHDRIRFYNEIDLGVPDGTAEAEQAYVDFLIAKWFNLRGGVVLVPFGKFNLDHFDPRRDLTDRPIVAQQIVPTTWGDLGASAFGFIPWTSNVISTYEVAVINGLTDAFSPTNDGLQNAKSDLGRDNNGNKAVVGRATLKLVDQYEIGFSGYRGASDPSAGRGQAIWNEHGKPIRISGSFRDITGQKMAEEELQKANVKLQELDHLRTQFFADISHELRTPLTVIRGEAEVTLRGRDKPVQEYKMTLGRIVQLTKEVNQMVNDLLFLARSESGTLVITKQECSLRDLLYDVHREAIILVQKKSISVTLNEPDQEILIDGDPQRLKQLYLILLDNAVKYSEAKSQIDISLALQDQEVTVTIADHGRGIPETDLPHIFERFYRVSAIHSPSPFPPGAGLGLAIAKWITEAHQGRITITSHLGSGTQILVTLKILPESSLANSLS